MTTLPFGSWSSPLDPAMVARASASDRDSIVSIDPQGVWTCEQQPTHACLVWRDVLGRVIKQTTDAFDVGSRINEYGGRAAHVVDSVAFFSNRSDGHVYMWHGGSEPRRISPTTEVERRYADFVYDKANRRLIAVMEELLPDREPRQSLVALSIFGCDEVVVLAQGADFYAAPRLDPTGTRLAWIEWNHPHMPWDGSCLFLAPYGEKGLGEPMRVAGGEAESVVQPLWSLDGILYWISDASGFWNLYRLNGAVEPVWPLDAEFATPPWTLGLSNYGFFDLGVLVCSYFLKGRWHLALVDTETLENVTLPSEFTYVTHLRASSRHVAFMGASPTSPLAPFVLTRDFRIERLIEERPPALAPEHISRPEPRELPSPDGRTIHAYYYAPKNAQHTAPSDQLPPLIVMAHGGPTSAFNPFLSLRIQLYTTRGFAVLCVDYCGSSGYGRAYRDALKGRWGEADIADCAHAAQALAAQGVVDGSRMVISGGSAGGYIALGAMAFHDVFAAAISYYGVSELALLRSNTHKFESHYLQGLLGTDYLTLERARSPLFSIAKVRKPILFLHGLDDKVVPPDQSRLMHETLKANGVPTELVEFEGEGHGFRNARNVAESFERELDFLRKHVL